MPKGISIHINDPVVERKLDLVLKSLTQLHEKVNKMAMSDDEAAAALEALGNQLQKATQEIIAAAAAQGPVSPRLEAAINALLPIGQTLDDLNPDTP